jgi:hypothetical protein
LHYQILGCKDTIGLAAGGGGHGRRHEFCYFVIHVVAWAIEALLFIARDNAAENLTDLPEMTE